MFTLISEESMFERFMGCLFPPELGQIDHSDTIEYHYRLSRNGVESQIDYTKPYDMQFVAAARVEGEAQEKRIIHLPGRIV